MTELIVDSFAGGGGASTGIEQALGRPVDIAVNHDPEAIAVHEANHPRTRHFQEDVWELNLEGLTGGQPVGLLWASPDCKHFSRAKGGAPVSPRVRGLAWVVLKWIHQVRPRVILLENVPEFTTWGPLGPDGRPCPRRKGKTFRAFLNAIRRRGYRVETRELTACDYGAPTSRTRLFLVARCDGLPIVWPSPTHGPGRPEPYRTAAECIDWSEPIPSIFLTPEEAKAWGKAHGRGTPKRPLAEATLRRIAAGVQRYVIDAAEPFVLKYLQNSVGTSILEPIHTIIAGGGTPERPGTGGGMALVAPTLIQTGQGERPGQRPRYLDLHDPLGTIVGCGQRHGLVAAFLAKHCTGVVGQDLRGPADTVVGRDQKAVVTSHLVHLRNNCDGRDVLDPLPTLTAGAGHVGEVRSFLTHYNGSSIGQPAGVPAATIPASDRLGLVVVHGELYRIADIGMRMLQPHELSRAQGFPPGYLLTPPGRRRVKSSEVRMVGNSVCPDIAAALVSANCADMAVGRGQLGMFSTAGGAA